MNGREQRRFAMLTRVLGFREMHAHLFGGTSAAHEAFATVTAQVQRLEALAVAERTAAQASGAAVKAAAQALLAGTLTRAIATARVIAKTTPQMEVAIRLPLPADSLLLLTLARQCAAVVASCASRFDAFGVRVGELEECIAGFERALQARRSGQSERIEVRGEIALCFRRAMDAVAILDVVVANDLRANPVAMAVWKEDRLFHRRRRRAGTMRNEAQQQSAGVELRTAFRSRCSDSMIESAARYGSRLG